MNLKIFNKNVPFSKAAGFSQKLKSPAGSVFLASTEKDEPTIRISPAELPAARIKEHVMRIPLNKRPYAIQIGAVIPGPRPDVAVVGGPRPDAAVVGGPRPDAAVIGGTKPGVIGGPREPQPKIGHFIVIGGPKPKTGTKPRKSGKKSEPLFVELDATTGNWHIEPDLDADVLNISFDGSKSEE